jgi:hypothetical protein
MVQPKYSPEEALQRIKLMMEYDSSKTLDENKKVISEQDTLAKTGIATAAGTGLGAAAGGAAAAAGASVAGGATGTAFTLGATLAPNIAGGAVAATALGGAVLGGAAALALTPLVIWYLDKDNAKSKVERIIQYCTTDKSKIDKLERGISDGDVRNLSDQLYDAMKGVGTDEEAVYGAFKSLKTASDFCALVARFNKDYGGEGDLLEFLDDDFDQTSEWMQIFRPLRDIVEDSLLSIQDDDGKKKTGGGGGGSKKSGLKYNPCSGTYKYGCKSDTIAKVQGCLGFTGRAIDGKFGPNTKAALLGAKGLTSFTDADVTKICEKTNVVTPPKDEFTTQVDGESPEDILNN